MLTPKSNAGLFRAFLLIFLTVSFITTNTIFAFADVKTLVIAGSDFQSDDAASNVESILNAMKKDGYDNPTGLIFAGDYARAFGVSAKKSNAGIRSLKNSVATVYPNLKKKNMILTQGNHETEEGINYALSGAHDTDKYGVYVINEDDYMWNGVNDYSENGKNKRAIAKNTAKKLAKYLNNKIKTGYTKPIFIPSHVALHVTSRTEGDGDSIYAEYIFDVLNKAGAAGLNIIFLYGHNHSQGFEDFHGGSAVFYKPGDSINIAKLPNELPYDIIKKPYKTKKLHFVYMNAGYVGYYHAKTKCDNTLTMTNFLFDDKTLTIARYDEDGLHNLKSKGIAANDVAACPADTKVYKSPQTIKLKKVNTTKLIKSAS